MKPLYLTLAALLVIAGALGCGGTGAPFGDVGLWKGTWTDTATGQNGTISLVVATDDAGSISGGLQNATTGGSAAIAGSLSRNRYMQIYVQYPGVTYSGYGPVSVTTRSNITTLAGYFTLTKGKTVVTDRFSIDLEKQ